MKETRFSVGGLICIFIGVLFFFGALYAAFGNDSPILAALCIVGGLLFISLGKNSFSKNGAKADSVDFLKSGSGGEKLVNEVLTINDIDTLIHHQAFAEGGVKVITLDHDNKHSLILTKSCIYEGVFGSYDFPGRGIKNVRFKKGIEIIGTQKVQLDEGRMASAGLFAGGLGVAAMNVASAREANANGGATIASNSGFFSFDLSVRENDSHVYVTILRKDLIKKYGNPFPDCHCREGKFFNAYYTQSFKAGRCVEVAKQMTEFLIQVQENAR